MDGGLSGLQSMGLQSDTTEHSTHQQQPDEEIQGARSQTKKLLSLWSGGPAKCRMEAFSEKGPQGCPLGALWRLHPIVTIN